MPSAWLAVYMQLFIYMNIQIHYIYVPFWKTQFFCNDCSQRQIDATNACHSSRNIMHADQCHHKMIFLVQSKVLSNSPAVSPFLLVRVLINWYTKTIA